MSRRSQPGRRRHVPQRTCIACQRTDSKRRLIRIVRTADSGVQVDLTGKRSGRGAYLCADRSCWERAMQRSQIERALKTSLQPDEKAALVTFAASLPQATDAGPAAQEDRQEIQVTDMSLSNGVEPQST